MTRVGVGFPTVGEVTAAVHDTRMLLRLRWRMVRGPAARFTVAAGLVTLFVLLFAASETGEMVRRFADEGVRSTAGQFATNVVVAFQRGSLGGVGAAALGSTFAAGLFSPFTGVANVALAAADDLSGVRPARLHRYFDALITQAVSAIGCLQLLTLTAVTSLLTLDGGRTGGLLVTWAVWVTVLVATVAEGWMIEWVYRAAGGHTRRILAAVLATGIGVAVWLDPAHGRTLFGLGNVYVAAVHTVGRGRTVGIAEVAGVIAAATVILTGVGIAACAAALRRPAPPRNPGRRRTVLRQARHPRLAMWQMLAVQTVRTAEIRRPLVAVLALGVPAVWLTGGSKATASTLVLAVPLTVGLAWGVNVFGMLGPAMPWLASQPRVMRRLLAASLTVQVTTTAVIAGLCWGPAWMFGVLSTRAAGAVAAGLVVSTAMTARVAAAKSVHRPYATRLGARGDVMLPPLPAINYALRFALWSGQLGVIVFSQSNRLTQLVLAAVVVTWSAVRYAQLARCWQRPDVQAHVVATVGVT